MLNISHERYGISLEFCVPADDWHLVEAVFDDVTIIDNYCIDQHGDAHHIDDIKPGYTEVYDVEVVM